MYQSHLLSESQLLSLRSLFNKADRSGNQCGSLSAAQVSTLLRIALGEGSHASSSNNSKGVGSKSTVSKGPPAAVSEIEIRDLLAQVDLGEDGGEGRCDFDEFVNLFTREYFASSSSSGGVSGFDGGDEDENNSHRVNFLSTAELQELKTTFQQLDRDMDEKLGVKDLIQAFASIGDVYSMDEMEDMIREIDLTGQAKISLADFLAAMSPA